MPRRPSFLPLRWLGSLALFLGSWLGGPPAVTAQAASDTTHLELDFLDVGQGDAILIRLGSETVMVDASRGSDIILYLEAYHVDTLVAAIASHNHDDHIGGMVAVLADHPVGRYIFNQRRPENQHGAEVLRMLAERGIDAPPPPWPPILLGDVRITIFPTALDPEYATENNSSLGVLVERGSFRALLTGDSEVEELNAWMTAGMIPRVTVLKAAHHGARNGVTPGWLLATHPEVVVISVGANNAYGHPDPWALRYYAAGGRAVYRTDRDGTVVVSVDSTGHYTVGTTGPIER
jgi:beta-lactamase superfamily II metal-dependent hydrolase